MKIGIDISQLAFQNTGVANYLGSLIKHLIEEDKNNHYVLFYSSLRKSLKSSPGAQISNFKLEGENVEIKQFRIPPTILDLIWNRLHIFPIEYFTGDIDIFISSDWTQPPTRKAKKATILYDLVVYKYPNETDSKIVSTHKRRLAWVKKECDAVFCISKATKKDAEEILGIDKEKLFIAYPGGIV